MVNREHLGAALTRMEYCLTETRQNLALVERRLCDRAEAETISKRSKSRWYHRRMSRWTGADEAEYRRILDRMTNVAEPELDHLRHKAERRHRGPAMQIPHQRGKGPGFSCCDRSARRLRWRVPARRE